MVGLRQLAVIPLSSPIILHLLTLLLIVPSRCRFSLEQSSCRTLVNGLRVCWYKYGRNKCRCCLLFTHVSDYTHKISISLHDDIPLSFLLRLSLIVQYFLRNPLCGVMEIKKLCYASLFQQWLIHDSISIRPTYNRSVVYMISYEKATAFHRAKISRISSNMFNMSIELRKQFKPQLLNVSKHLLNNSSHYSVG